MPNYVSTILVLNGSTERVAEVRKFVRNYETGSAFDFNKIVPMPETFAKYDTTNHPNGRGLEVGKPIGWEKDSPIATAELIEEYRQETKRQQVLYGVVG